ncbi:hypothetical protein PHYBOEH_004856 [Phytophthora boehmeriae]|uniref:Uncharacterized protein n=1 Tax=Phytophthora boehmeriae TaxID=109152 RepID=A0A8T1WQN5_9STRA|nr:hypothetical protein PHYBOEH_004856 [Phytophthora boehmeriae]
MSDSVRSTGSDRFSTQLTSQWRDSSTEPVMPRIGRKSMSSRSDASSPEGFKLGEPNTDSIFKDFDQRMEQIRSSLNAIASGKPHLATPPKNFKRGGAHREESPKMDVSRTRPTLLDASKISSGLEDDQDDKRKSRSNREAELRQLLQELNRINTSSD